MITADHAAFLAVILAGYLLLLIVNPVHRCPACKGRKSVENGRSRKPCTRCKTTGKVYRRGAVFVHGQIREHLWPLLRLQILDRVTARTEDAARRAEAMQDEP